MRIIFGLKVQFVVGWEEQSATLALLRRNKKQLDGACKRVVSRNSLLGKLMKAVHLRFEERTIEQDLQLGGIMMLWNRNDIK